MKNEKRLTTIIERPKRDADYVSARGVEYWWSDDWVRSSSGTVGRIKPVKQNGDVHLHMVSKAGNLTYIRGRIQKAFRQWHLDRSIDYLLLGVDEETDLTPEWSKVDV